MKKQRSKRWFRSIQGQLIITCLGVNLVICLFSYLYIQKNLTFMNQYIEKTGHINDINRLYGYQKNNYELLTSFMETSLGDVQAEEGQVEIQTFQYNMTKITSLLEDIAEAEQDLNAKLRLRVLPYLEKSFENKVISIMTMNQGYDYSSRYMSYLEALEYHLKINNYIQEILSINMDTNQEYYLDTEQNMITTSNSYVAIILLICLMNIIFFGIYNAYLTKPIKTIANKVKSIGEGQWDIDMSHVGGPEEIQGLAGKIAIMTDNIKKLSNEVQDKAKLELQLVEEELEHVRMMELLKEVQLQGLQMQIHPHFLFNTLNVISRMALIEDSSKTYELIIALSKFMRHSLKPVNKKIALIEEVDMITQYLFILKSRMGDQLETNVYVEENVRLIKIPMLTLQPIVENAFKHGLEDKIQGGKITIDIRTKKEGLKIRICDNGIGMNHDLLQHIRKVAQITTVDFTKDDHIGIENVCYRLNTTFGSKVSYQVASSKGKGTMFVILLKEQGEI